jgi:hypothetical protein
VPLREDPAREAPRRRLWASRRFVIAAILATAVVGGGLGAWRHRMAASHRFVPPVFVDPPAGPRTPSAELFGVTVGSTRVKGVEARTTAWGLSCSDRSVHTMMGELRDKKREELRRATEAGHPDTVTGASIVSRRTSHDENPQVRFSCEEADASRLADRTRMPSRGRLLFVFDTAEAPLRHASFERRLATWEDARADFDEARRALSSRFGPPHETGTDLDGGKPIPKYSRRVAEWRYADLHVRVSVANLGGRGFAVNEVMEVPWPVRASAPSK